MKEEALGEGAEGFSHGEVNVMREAAGGAATRYNDPTVSLFRPRPSTWHVKNAWAGWKPAIGELAFVLTADDPIGCPAIAMRHRHRREYRFWTRLTVVEVHGLQVCPLNGDALTGLNDRLGRAADSHVRR